MMKSTLLISTVLSELPAEVIKMFTNKEAIALHQDPWGVQARRVSSVRPAGSTRLQAPFNAWVVLRKCEADNPRQLWRHGGEPGGAPPSSNGSIPARLWTTDEQGKRWCIGEGSWARPAEVMPCDDPQFDPQPDEVL